MAFLKNQIRKLILKILSVNELNSNSQIHQTMIVNQYTLMKKLMTPQEMPSLKDVGFRLHSQF